MGDPVTFFEIGCRDISATSLFYSQLFDWNVHSQNDYSATVSTGEDHALDGQLVALGHEPHNYITIYVDVLSMDDTLRRVVDLGGCVVLGPMTISQGRFSWIKDPEGTTTGLVERSA